MGRAESHTELMCSSNESIIAKQHHKHFSSVSAVYCQYLLHIDEKKITSQSVISGRFINAVIVIFFQGVCNGSTLGC